MSRITVIGLDGRPPAPEIEGLLGRAALVIGGERHLDALGVEPERSVVLKGDLSASLERIEGSAGPVAVLASGDPGFFGIVRLLAGRFGHEDLRVIPAVSSVALAFARAGLPWDDAVTVSAHGRDPRRAVNVCRAYPKVAVLTSPDFGPADLARELRDAGRTFFVGERLGGPDERVFRGEAAEIVDQVWRDPNVVLVVDEKRALGDRGCISGSPRVPGYWALPEDAFAHRSGMITKPETRALALARLGPGPGDLVWDVGAGSGSIAVECARLGAAAVAVERDPDSCVRIRENASRHQVYMTVVEGVAPEALRDLPEPDAVFVGGTGDGFEEILELCAVRARRAVVVSLIGIERVVPAGDILAGCGLEVETTLLQASRVKSVGALHRLVSGTPVFVVSGMKP